MDLTEMECSAFLNKQVQNYIPWRICFSGSASTPARPVFDASTRTHKNPDNSGGRCYNDLTCKGKITSLNLTRLLLIFMIGRAGITGDLSQFYNTCKLIPTHWNLQRILWKSDLDSKATTEEAIIQSCQLTRNFGPKPEFGPNGQNDPKKARILAFWPDF